MILPTNTSKVIAKLLGPVLLVAAASMLAVGASHAAFPEKYAAPKYLAPRNAPAEITIVTPDEPGERLIVQGQVLDGDVPIPGVSIYLLQADAEGHYNKDGPDHDDYALIVGAIRSDRDGHFQYSTIRPGGYNGGPGHVHYIVRAEGYKPALLELWFEDDPVILARKKAGEPVVPSYMPADVLTITMPVRDDQGVWHCTHDLMLESE